LATGKSGHETDFFPLLIQNSFTLNLDADHPNVAKAGVLQSQSVRDEGVVAYRDPLTKQDLKSSGFPVE
jgi:hypothetical protein